MSEPARIPVTITVTETFTFDVEPDWFADTVGPDCTADELWAAVKQWNAERPKELWEWIDGQGESSIVLTRTETGEALTDEPAS